MREFIKVMSKFKMNEDKRIIRAYKDDIVSDEDFEQLERLSKLGYKVIVVPKKIKKYTHIKIDMIKYLEGNIDEDIYNNFIDGVEKKKDFLTLRWELRKSLQKREAENAIKEKREVKNIDFEYIEQIVNQAKSRENKLIENIKGTATIEQEQKSSGDNKNKPNENK